MSKEKQRITEGYKPEKVEKGYQPTKPQGVPTGDENPNGGYQPSGTGDSPANTPTPPADE